MYLRDQSLFCKPQKHTYWSDWWWAQKKHEPASSRTTFFYESSASVETFPWTTDLKKAQNKSSENLWSDDTQNLWCDEVQDLCADEIRRIETTTRGQIAMIGARLSSGASPVVEWKKSVGATPQIQTVWKPTKTGAKRKKGEKHNELGSRGPPAPKCANACELARAIPLLSLAYCAKTETGNQTKQGVFHTVALRFTLKKFLNVKRRIMETQIFHHAKIYFSKNPLKETKILQDVITL
jgi:hypothetical protein